MNIIKKNIVFLVSFITVFSIVIFGIFYPQQLDIISKFVHFSVIENFGWGYLLASFIFLVFCFIIAFGPTGKIRLGKDSDKPEYSYFSWFSMMFAAGMGIGLIFWGTAEPLSHYFNPPEHITPESAEAAAFAIQFCFFHWGLHPWSIYIIMSLSIAYFSFRRGMPPLISSCFYPLIGDKIYGIVGYLIDILAVIATIFGVATSLGFGALQITEGLSFVFGISNSMNVTIIIIAIVTVLFLTSSITGLDTGIQVLSRSNIIIAILLLAFMFIVGPTVYILNIFTSSIGGYLSGILNMSLNSNPFSGYEWTKSWTIFYWAWWIAWSPFVGLFVARISKGRTIKEFILGTMLVPTVLTFIWFSIFGGAALNIQFQEGIDIMRGAEFNTTTVLFQVFSFYPLTNTISFIAVILLLIFFVTSADSATFVLGMMSSNGNLNPSILKKMIWGLTESVVALILLLSGGLSALQQMAISAALPFTFVMTLLCLSLYIALIKDVKNQNRLAKKRNKKK